MCWPRIDDTLNGVGVGGGGVGVCTCFSKIEQLTPGVREPNYICYTLWSVRVCLVACALLQVIPMANVNMFLLFFIHES